MCFQILRSLFEIWILQGLQSKITKIRKKKSHGIRKREQTDLN